MQTKKTSLASVAGPLLVAGGVLGLGYFAMRNRETIAKTAAPLANRALGWAAGRIASGFDWFTAITRRTPQTAIIPGE
jgi:hypothetical protein